MPDVLPKDVIHIRSKVYYATSLHSNHWFLPWIGCNIEGPAPSHRMLQSNNSLIIYIILHATTLSVTGMQLPLSMTGISRDWENLTFFAFQKKLLSIFQKRFNTIFGELQWRKNNNFIHMVRIIQDNKKILTLTDLDWSFQISFFCTQIQVFLMT